VAAFDIDGALRWARFDPPRTLARRADSELPFAGEKELAGQALLLDTCVYIDQMQGCAPVLVEQLVDTRQFNHSTVAIQELMHTVGVLNPMACLDEPFVPVHKDANVRIAIAG
jgi:hypothetical protein